MTKKFLKAVFTVWFSVSRIGLVLPLFEWLSAVGADKALWVKLVSHSSDHSPIDHLGANTTPVLGRRII